MSIVLQNQASSPALMEWNESKLQLLKDTFFKGSTDQEFNLFAHAVQRTGLDPFMRQIHPVKRWDSKLGKEVMTIQTGIDGYRLIAERTGKYVPGREPTFTYDQNGKLLSATAYVKKLAVDGTWHEVSAEAFYDEYVQTKKDGSPTSFWEKMPRNQLAKCAEALALRKAFPADLSGIYTTEEMAQASKDQMIPGIAILPPEDLPEMTDKERDEYIEKKAIELETAFEMFKAFMDSVKKARDWTYRKCSTAFEKDPVYTAKAFADWIAKNPTIEAV